MFHVDSQTGTYSYHASLN